MKASVFIEKLKDVALNHKTLYVMGCFGAPMTAANKKRYTQNHEYNKRAARTKMIQAASEDTFGFDCVCLIKGILWGWCGDASRTYGGAGYAVNGVPDIGADDMIKRCSGVSTTGWDKMVPGEAVWCKGHIGVYIGDGLSIECTPAWKNKVQITAVKNIGAKAGYNARQWTKHGKLPYIEYDVKGAAPEAPRPVPAASSGVLTDKQIWDALMSKIGNPFGVAAVMGHFYAESGLKPNNLQNTTERKLGMSDAEYTAAVDAGAYTNFANDGGGYGYAQWTFHTRKASLLAYARGAGKSIGDGSMQLDFFWKELNESFPSVLKALKTATSVRAASDIMLTKYECPADQSEAAKVRRASCGQQFYDTYAKAGAAKPTSKPTGTVKIDYAQSFDKTLAGKYRVTAPSGLHVRSGAGTGKTSLGVLSYGTVLNNYGYFSTAAGVRWLYVRTPNGVLGFCSTQHLCKC